MSKVLNINRIIKEVKVGGSLPDVDIDFEGERRGDVLAYMERKYGKDYFTAIGTYGTFKIKSALKDLARERGVNFSKTNYIASLIDDAKANFTDLFKLAAQKPDLKKFIQKNHRVIENIPLCLGQVKTGSIHASGVVIVPKSEKGIDIYRQMPVRISDGVLVSEWEGTWIDKAGFLKFDILGLKQLDKFAAIAKLIKQNKGIDIDYASMSLEDEYVYEMFREGYTEDVFQFGTSGLKAYCKDLKPDNIEDLIAAVALYRPSTMESGLHNKYIKIKHEEEKPVYDDGCYEATKDTFGIAVYQEQVMQICRDVAGFNLVEADDIRKAMGKKDRVLLDTYKEKFIAGAIKNGFEKGRMVELWEKLESFAGYGFNRSHAACYGIMGYFSLWLKVHYPLEFWTVSLQYSEEDEIINRIGEISNTTTIKVVAVDINHSTTEFHADVKANAIYWAMNSVKWVGDKAVEQIFAERNENGMFFSIEDFCQRMKSRMEDFDGTNPVNRRVIVNLILSGAFDETEKIEPHQRGLLLNKFATFTGQKLSEELQATANYKPYQWVLKQKELTGLGYLDYKKIVAGSNKFAAKQKNYTDLATLMQSADYDYYSDVVISGIIEEVKEWSYKKKEGKYCTIAIQDNTTKVNLRFWDTEYEKHKGVLIDAKGKLIILNAKLYYDSFFNGNGLVSTNKTDIEII